MHRYIKNNSANCISFVRILFSIVLLTVPVFSPQFYFCYLAAGFSDVIDGIIARKLKVVSDFGSKLDTAADVVFVCVSLIRIIPAISLPGWIVVWIGIIAIIKVFNILYGMIRMRKMIAIHSVLNKITGIILFILPLTFSLIDIKYSSVIVCSVATAAALTESYSVIKGKI